ncbi:class I SAM-dependent methyltransferase [Frankia canadensis]|uniref:class I SAM-dependent methyltransferase n=1 Tax=Frankia canadensis TaxID=1836972 RepID=UPI000C7DE362|nr:class I SAM-dependent methyltransferase [Frankia canadensis]
MATSVNFDRIAHDYDATRGGEERGRHVADALAPHLPDGLLLEIGVGTGLVAQAFAARGRRLLGVDLSERMLARARERVPGRLARADASALPLPADSVDACVAVHVLHLVGDPEGVFTELARVLRPGGRLATVGAGEIAERSDVGDVMERLRAALRLGGPRHATAETLRASAARHGLRLVEDFHFPREERGALTPAQVGAQIEGRVWSHLWDLTDAEWATVVEPALDALRRLPDPDRPRPGRRRSRALLFDLDATMPAGG